MITIGKLIRALGRLFAFDGLGDDGKRLSSELGDFTRLSDDQLGTRRYEV